MGEYAVSRRYWLKESNLLVCVCNTRIPDMEYNGALILQLIQILRFSDFFFL